MPSLRAYRRFAMSVVFASSVLTVQAAEVSPANKVETTPGLSPESIRKAFDSQRQTLAPCQRVVGHRNSAEGPDHRLEFFVWNPAPDTDDRIRVRFTLTPEGKIEKTSRKPDALDVHSLYLQDHCVKTAMERWTFPTFPGNVEERVHVELWARFKTTEAERAAELARSREDFNAFCKAASALGSDKALPPRKQWNEAHKRYLAERGPRMSPNVRGVVEAVSNVNIPDAIEILETAMDETTASRIDCPRFTAWKKLPPN
ncbi:hypothetical protein [Myxococcus hansupus]|nr:hypothetical protein [Myxococcus hansupus]